MNEYSRVGIGSTLMYYNTLYNEKYPMRLMYIEQDEEYIWLYLAYIANDNSTNHPWNGYNSKYGFKYGEKIEAGDPNYYDPKGAEIASEETFKEYYNLYGVDI